MIRKYKEEDCSSLAQLFYKSVHNIKLREYNEEQLSAWATGHVDMNKWNTNFSNNYTLVMELDEKIVGFADISDTGYLDHLYVHPRYQGLGVATKMVEELELISLKNGVEKIEVHASITARPFFEKRGYQILRDNIEIRNSIFLKNYIMLKKLNTK